MKSKIVQKFKDEDVSRKTLLWKEGMKDWIILEKIPDFRGLVNDIERSDPSLNNGEVPPEIPNLPDLPEAQTISKLESSPDILRYFFS